ncbi:heavy metal sensor histidine kinase [Caballeronia sp. DA-9]|uniref:heavy metal sensor histidine kinase n=1 Tax=Caballeronia sp. DA-9 TaxID=3436237 RepID=UPI003F6726F4
MKITLLPRTLRARLTILFAVSTSVLLAISGLLLYEALKTNVASMSEKEMMTTLTAAQSHLSDVRTVEEVASDSAPLYDPLHGHQNMDLALYDAQGRRLAGTSGFRASNAVLAAKASTTPTKILMRGTTLRYLVAIVPLDGPQGPIVRVAVQYDARSERALLRAYALSVLFVVVIGTMATAAVAYLIASFGLRPLAQLTTRAEAVSSSRLAQPLPEAEMAGELKDLSHAFNRMLARLDDSFTRLSRFSSDLAHDMRTPLTNLLAEAQVALSQPRSGDEYRVVIESSVDECQRLSRMIDDMLFLARSDNAQQKPVFVAINGRSEADRVAGFYEIMAEDAGVSIDVAGEANFNGDPLLIQRAISNLVSNAIAHAPQGSSVQIRCQAYGTSSEVSVTDFGRGISAEHIGRIFDRFYRVDPSRHGSASGTGLGLAIVRSIMQEHGGDCTVTSIPNVRTTFKLCFPTANGGRDGLTNYLPSM